MPKRESRHSSMISNNSNGNTKSNSSAVGGAVIYIPFIFEITLNKKINVNIGGEIREFLKNSCHIGGNAKLFQKYLRETIDYCKNY